MNSVTFVLSKNGFWSSDRGPGGCLWTECCPDYAWTGVGGGGKECQEGGGCRSGFRRGGCRWGVNTPGHPLGE